MSAGRNQLVDEATTLLVIFTDDDHEVSPQTLLDELVHKLETSKLDRQHQRFVAEVEAIELYGRSSLRGELNTVRWTPVQPLST